MSGPQIKSTLEETVREYSKIKELFNNINSLPDYSDNPALIRSVEVIYENLHKIREEVVRFQQTLPPPTEGFKKDYKTPDMTYIQNGSTKSRKPKPQSALTQTSVEPEAKVFDTPGMHFMNKIVCKSSGWILLMISAFAWVAYNIFKFKWGFENTAAIRGVLTYYFVAIGIILPILGFFAFSKRKACSSCGGEWIITPFSVEGFEIVTCPGCSSVFPLSMELIAYRSTKFVLVLLPFYLSFVVAGPACFAIWGFLLTNFVVSFALQQFFYWSNR